MEIRASVPADVQQRNVIGQTPAVSLFDTNSISQKYEESCHASDNAYGSVVGALNETLPPSLVTNMLVSALSIDDMEIEVF